MKPTRTRCAFGAEDYMRPGVSRAAILSNPPPGSLFAPETHTRATDPDTSKQAAKKVSARAAAQWTFILNLLKRGPIKAQAFYAACLAEGIQNPRARVSDLRDRGHKIKVKNHEYRLIA